MSAFLEHFDRELAPLLALRAQTFRRVFELLEENGRDFYTIVETGVAHLASASGTPEQLAMHGHSTLLFDRFVNAHDGVVYSVDLSLNHCDQAQTWVSDKVRIFCQDSRTLLAGFRPPTPIDCVYLDSYDVDWNDPHPSALHHMHEICALLPVLNPGCIVFVDDSAGGGGKAGYVADVMRRAGAELLFDEYQIGWRLTSAPRRMRAFGHHDAEELDFMLARSKPRRYRYVRRDLDERVLELLPGGGIGRGRERCEERWFVDRGEDGRIGLAITGGGRVTARLQPEDAEDAFRGQWLFAEACEVSLLPLPLEPKDIAAGRYWLRPVGGAAQIIELAASHEVAWCRSFDAETWRAEHDGGGRPSLVLSAAGHDTGRFAPAEDGCWRGYASLRTGAGTPPSASLRPASFDFIGPVSDAERSARAELIAQRRFRYRRGRRDEWPIELLPNGRIGRGASATEAAWDVEDDGEGGLSLLIYARDTLRVRLVRSEDGTFHGTWPLDGRPPVVVEPMRKMGSAYLMPVLTACLPRERIRRILEVGSGDGTDTLALARYYGAEVFAFECNPDILPSAVRNLEGRPHVTLVPKAAGAEDGRIEFFRVTNGNPYASSRFRANPAYPYERYAQERCEVEMIRLERWLGEREIEAVDLLVMDVQGATFDVLRGLGPYLDRVRYIVTELGTRDIYQGEMLAPAVIALLREHGFHLLRWFDQWGVLPTGELVDEPCFLPQYAGLESWFGDYLFVRHTARERDAAAHFAGRRFRYERLGQSGRELELLPDGQIVAPHGGPERSWVVREGEGEDGSVELLFADLYQVTCRLTAGADGRWRGREISHDRAPVLLEPFAESEPDSLPDPKISAAPRTAEAPTEAPPRS